MSNDHRGGSRALIVLASALTADRADEWAGQPARHGRPQAQFVVQLLACKAGFNGYRARQRADARTGAATYGAAADRGQGRTIGTA